MLWKANPHTLACLQGVSTMSATAARTQQRLAACTTAAQGSVISADAISFSFRPRPMIDQRTAPSAAFLLRMIAGLFIAASTASAPQAISLWWNGLVKATRVLAYTLSAEFASAVPFVGIYTRWVTSTWPMMMGATHFWMVRKSFWFVEGAEALRLMIMLLTQALLGDGAFAIKVPSLPWERRLQKAPA